MDQRLGDDRMTSTPGDRSGFTMIELMIVVAIVGLLAALSFSEYQRFLLRAKRAELPMHVDAIRTAQWGYNAEWSVFTSCAQAPASMPGRTSVPFPATPSTALDWNMVGWVPDGKVYGQYRVEANDLAGELASFDAYGEGDLDGDGNHSEFQGSVLDKPRMLTGNDVY
jgi:prepilin-type N-terminal cleavage/methylation domain-containing protein